MPGNSACSTRFFHKENEGDIDFVPNLQFKFNSFLHILAENFNCEVVRDLIKHFFPGNIYSIMENEDIS